VTKNLSIFLILDYPSICLDILGIVLALGAGVYLCQTAIALNGDVLQRGMLILAATPFLIALSATLDLLSELGILTVYDALHFFARIVFILVFFVGARSIVQAWRGIK
jgi:hypothetical protein